MKKYTKEEVSKHNTETDCWCIVHKKVYDITKYLDLHPGGLSLIFSVAGEDGTDAFEAIVHSQRARKILSEYYIGDLGENSLLTKFHSLNIDSKVGYPFKEPVTKEPTSFKQKMEKKDISPIDLKVQVMSPNNGNFKGYQLIDVKKISADTKIFKFEVPNNGMLDLPIGRHIQVQVHDNFESVIRKYTPISNEKGYFELLVKVYPKGVVSSYIHSLSIGNMLSMDVGPHGKFEYTPNKYKKLAMIAAGTGITPIYQIIKSVAQDVNDTSKMYLLYANRTEEDILLKTELEKFKENKRLNISYLLSQPLKKSSGDFIGRVDEDMIFKSMDLSTEKTFFLICGPDGFCESVVKILKGLAYKNTDYHIF